MSPQFLAMLPRELQVTVREAEQLAGCDIAVVCDAGASEFDNLSLGLDRGTCSATIAYCGETISRCALVHEVLHIKRNWVDAVPYLKPTTRLRYENEAMLVNELVEHLIIIPEERRFAKEESDAHWSSVLENLSESPGFPSHSGRADVEDFERSLLLQRAMMDIALPGLDPTRIYARLRDANLLESSAAFVEGLRGRLDDKERALIFVIQNFRYDLAGFCIGKFNLRTDPKSVLYSAALSNSPWANVPKMPS